MILYFYYVLRHNIASVFSQEKYGRHVSNKKGVEKQNKKWNENPKY